MLRVGPGAAGTGAGEGLAVPGCGDCEDAGSVELGPADAFPRSAGGPVGLPSFGAVLVGGAGVAGGPDCSSLTTSRWATTEGGRSVTSAATMEVAVQIMAVDARVATSHSAAPSSRGSAISTDWPFSVARGIRER
ncbi:MAG: hypothetical protein DLM54_11100 [Acidimicrobiales bacterium]|nr:MAG: hypothetical protein DLM54_11100 [Acidimicrobiales bacterium]